MEFGSARKQSLSDYTLDRLARVGALMRREKQTRFSGGALGYAWAYLTPVTWIVFVVIVFRLLDRFPPIAVGSAIFVATGILPYILFRQTISSVMQALPAHRYMIYVRPTSPSEILLASALLEALNMLLISTLIFGAIIAFLDAPFPADILRVILGLFLAWILAATFGRFCAVVSRMSDTFRRAVPIILRPMFWISGIFYTATELPARSLELLWYSPLFHAIEILREGFFLNYESPISDPMLPIGVALFFYIASVAAERYWQLQGRMKGLL